MNKSQLQARAKELNVSFDPEETNRQLEAKIAEAEQKKSAEDKNASNQSGGSFEQPEDDTAPAGVVTTSSFEGNKSSGPVEDATVDEEVKNSEGETVDDFEPTEEDPFFESEDEDDVDEVPEAEDNKPIGIITTDSFAPKGDSLDQDDPEPYEYSVDPVKPAAEPETPEPEADEEILRYTGTSGTYQIKNYKFDRNTPFAVVPKEFADSIGEDNPDLRKATKEEVEEFYK